MKTKTIKFKDIDARMAQYICQKEDDIECSHCPLHINIDNRQKIRGCYYLLKLLMEEEGEKTITV